MLDHGFGQTAVATGVGEDRLDLLLVVEEFVGTALNGGLFLEGIVHNGFSFIFRRLSGCFLIILIRRGLFGILVAVFALTKRHADQGVDHILLFLGERIEDIADGLSGIGVRGFVISRRISRRRRRFGVPTVRMCELLAGVDDAFVVEQIDLVAMDKADLVDECAGVGALQHQAHLTDVPVLDVAGRVLPDAVGVDRHGVDVAMANGLSGGKRMRRFVKGSVTIHAIVTVLENDIAKQVLGIVMVVLPYQRNGLTVLIGERILANGESVGAQQIVLGHVTAEVTLHLELLLLIVVHRLVLLLYPASIPRSPPSR